MSGRQLRRGFGEGEGTVRGSGEGSEKVVEEGRGERNGEKKERKVDHLAA